MVDTAELRKLAEGVKKKQFAIGETIVYECAEEIDRLRTELQIVEKDRDHYRELIKSHGKK